MKQFVQQIVLAAQGDDTKGWMNILFVVVLAVFWLISGIVKATSKKSQDSQKQQSLHKPVRKVQPPTLARDPSLTPPKRTTQTRSQPQLKSSPPQPRLGSIFQDIPNISSKPKPLMELEPMRLETRQRTSEIEDPPELVLDFTDPDELSKAILHYEILGPPVSLRNPSHQNTCF